jgi:hypothetical protein
VQRIALLAILITACTKADLTVEPPQQPARLAYQLPHITIWVKQPLWPQLVAFDRFDQPMALPAGVNYSSSSEATVTVGSNGVVTGLELGSATITARLGNLTASIGVTTQPSGLRIEPKFPYAGALLPGDTLLVQAVLYDAIGGTISCPTTDSRSGPHGCVKQVTWASEEPAILTIRIPDPEFPAAAVLSAIAGGATHITAADGNQSVTAFFTVQQHSPSSPGNLVVLSFEVREIQSSGTWIYTPMLRIRESSGVAGLDLIGIDLEIPGIAPIPRMCTIARLAAGSQLDLFGVAYGEFVTILRSYVPASGAVARATIRYSRVARGTGPEEALTATGPIVRGPESSDQYSIPAPSWDSCQTSP